MNIKQKQIKDVALPDDPRLRLPGISLYAQDSLGCSFLLISLLPCVALLFNSIAKSDITKYTQYAVIMLTLLWVSMWVSNYRTVAKLRHSRGSVMATAVDRFIDHRGETPSYVLVYELEYPGSGGQKQTARVRYYCYTRAEFDTQIGNRRTFYSIPINTIMAKLTGQLPIMLSVTSPDEFEVRISKWATISAGILTITSAAGLWIRAALSATELNWAAMLTAKGMARLYNSITSPSTLQQLWQTSQQVPTFALVSLIGLIVMVSALRFWRRHHDIP